MFPMDKSLTAKLVSRDEVVQTSAEEATSGFWESLPTLDRKTLVIAGSALGVGIVVGGTGVFLYRRWTDKLNQQVEVLSKSVGDVYKELRSLQQGMVQVQQTITHIQKEPDAEVSPGLQRRRRSRRLQFYDSDSEESVYFSRRKREEYLRDS